MPSDLQILGASAIIVPTIWLLIALVCWGRHGDIKAANGLAGIVASLLPLGILGFKILLMAWTAMTDSAAIKFVSIGPADSALVLAAICYQTTVIISDFGDHWAKTSKEAARRNKNKR